MPSLYSNVIRGKEISDKKLISPPILETIYSKEIEEKSTDVVKPEVDIDSIYKAIEKEAREKGNEIIKEYENRAQEIIENSHIIAETIKEEAVDKGYQDGYQKGYKEGYDYGTEEAKRENEEIINDSIEKREIAYKFLDECHIESRQYISQIQDEVIDIVMEVSKKVVLTEVTQNREVILSIIESAILKCADKDKIIIKLSPKNAAIIKEEKNRFSSLVDEKCNI
ncbi:MAG: FliH/SctL family protein, partial [Clostridium sp.]